jgi:hypothetical protein
MVSESTIMERELETPGGAERDGLHALVVGPEIFLAVGLPENGSVLIGRSSKAVLRVDDGLASREHARLHVKDGVIEVEDLDSTNGTHLGDTVVAGRRLAIDSLPLTIGSTTIIVQRSRWSLGARRICSHATFERRLREHCDHASSSETRFGLVRLRLEGDVPWFRVFPILARLVGPPHVFALYAPGHYELLVAEVGGATWRKRGSGLTRAPRTIRGMVGVPTHCWRTRTRRSSRPRSPRARLGSRRRRMRCAAFTSWSGAAPRPR